MSDQPSALNSPPDGGDTPAPIGVAELEIVAEEFAAFVERRLATMAPPEPALAPIVNVAPATAAVEVNVPQQAAPVVNVTVPEQAPPVVNVETAAPIINVATAAPNVTIENHPPGVTIPPPAVNVEVAAPTVVVDQEAVASAINESANAGGDLMRALIKSIDANTAAIKAQTEVISAPKSLVMRDGKPVGLKVGN